MSWQDLFTPTENVGLLVWIAVVIISWRLIKAKSTECPGVKAKCCAYIGYRF